MKRRILIILLFLLLGAIMNVAVAWGIWLFGEKPVPDPLNMPGNEGTIGKPELRSWERCRSDDWPARPDHAWDWSVFGSRFRDLIAVTGHFDSTDLSQAEFDALARLRVHYGVMVIECGWPRRCMVIERWHEFHYPMPIAYEMNGLALGRLRSPIRPIWSGFAVGSILYAALLGLVYFGPFALRRHLRAKRGRCVKCGYDLRGDFAAGCPECGWKREEAMP